jgi:selenocysteine lyase/cysteine desulfurase
MNRNTISSSGESAGGSFDVWSAVSLLPSQRHLFDIPDDVVYMNCAYMSALPKATITAGERALRRKGRPWMIEPPDFFANSETVRALFARLINASADDIALVPAVSYGMAQAANNIPVRTNQKILTLAEEFPSNVYPWADLAQRAGATVVAVPRPNNGDWTAALLAHFDPSVVIVAVPHCHWTDGGLLNLEAIGLACRRTGAALCIDGSQSLGALPFDVKQIDPDFVAVGTYKWLLGPYSAGFLYVAPRWQDGRPIEQSWIAREGSENFAGLVNYRSEFQPGARRFDVGQRSNFALNPAVKASLELLLEWSVPRIFATLKARVDSIAERAKNELDWQSVPPHLRAGHYLGLRFGGPPPVDLPKWLAAANVHVSVRGHSLRITPHVWNNDNDVETLFAVLNANLTPSVTTSSGS